MKNQKKTEVILFSIALVIYLITAITNITHLVYLFYSISISLFFFPIRVIIGLKNKNIIQYVLSSITIAFYLALSNIYYYIDSNIILDSITLILSLANIYLMFYYYRKDKVLFKLHLMLWIFIPAFIFL